MDSLQHRLLISTRQKSDILLPKGYRRVAGIKGVDGAYIDTCQAGNTYPTVKMRIKLLSTTPTGSYSTFDKNGIWGNDDGNNKNLSLRVYSSIMLDYGANNAHYTTSTYLNKWIDVEIGSTYFKIDGGTRTFWNSINSVTSDNINLFKGKSTQSARPLIVDYYQSYEGDVLARNMVACVREDDNTVGLFDMAGSVCPLSGTPLYINAGSGYFEAVDEVI